VACRYLGRSPYSTTSGDRASRSTAFEEDRFMRGITLRRTTLVTRAASIAVAGALAVGAAAGSSSPAVAAPRRSSARHVAIGGALVPRPRRASASAWATGKPNLTYHGGDVMRANTTHAIYWVPNGKTMSAAYQANIDQYFTDVATDSGATSNVYSVETQYYDTHGAIAYDQAFGGSIVVHKSFPRNGCTRYGGMGVCLTDKQIAVEVANVVTAQGWPTDAEQAYFLYLPKNVGTCIDRRGSACAFTTFCAYHWHASLGGQPVLYANEPYAETKKSCTLPIPANGNPADSTINTTSHEHREMINDPLGNAWFDRDGNEGSDKCAWRFGALLGATPDGPYNQVINGDPYLLQQEWSNATNDCELSAT
jgi:hypothetical protein